MKINKKMIVQGSVMLAVLLAVILILVFSFVSVTQKYEKKRAVESLKCSMAEVGLTEGLMTNFSGYLVYDNGKTIASVRITSEIVIAVMNGDIEPEVAFGRRTFPATYYPAAGVGATEIISVELHESLLSYDVVYLREKTE